MEDPVRFAQPIRDADIGSVGRAAEGISLDLLDGELAAEAPRDRLHELRKDLPRVVLLGPGDERGVSRDVRHDEKPFHDRDGTSGVIARPLRALGTALGRTSGCTRVPGP